MSNSNLLPDSGILEALAIARSRAHDVEVDLTDTDYAARYQAIKMQDHFHLENLCFYHVENEDGTITIGAAGEGTGKLTMTKEKWRMLICYLSPRIS